MTGEISRRPARGCWSPTSDKRNGTLPALEHCPESGAGSGLSTRLLLTHYCAGHGGVLVQEQLLDAAFKVVKGDEARVVGVKTGHDLVNFLQGDWSFGIARYKSL